LIAGYRTSLLINGNGFVHSLKNTGNDIKIQNKHKLRLVFTPKMMNIEKKKGTLVFFLQFEINLN